MTPIGTTNWCSFRNHLNDDLMKLSINNLELQARDLDKLRGHWRHVRSQTFSEVWLYREGGEALAILVNGDRARLMFLREPGDAGFHSVNPIGSNLCG
jgi:hypothetical protein